MNPTVSNLTFEPCMKCDSPTSHKSRLCKECGSGKCKMGSCENILDFRDGPVYCTKHKWKETRGSLYE